MGWKTYGDSKETSGTTEFNSQDRYLNIVMEIISKLNDAIIEGDASKMLRSLLALFNTTNFKIEAEAEQIAKTGKIKITAADLKKDIDNFANRILTDSANESLFKRNNVFYTQEIGRLQNAMLSLINAAGMIYPVKSYETIEEIIEKDF